MKWRIEEDTGSKMYACPYCKCRMIAKWYDLAVGKRGFSFCPYCGKSMKDDQMTLDDFMGEI